MDISALPAYLKTLQDAAATAAAPAANAMAEGVQNRIVNVTLRKTAHPPYTFFKAVMGSSPCLRFGESRS